MFEFANWGTFKVCKCCMLVWVLGNEQKIIGFGLTMVFWCAATESGSIVLVCFKSTGHKLESPDRTELQ